MSYKVALLQQNIQKKQQQKNHRGLIDTYPAAQADPDSRPGPLDLESLPQPLLHPTTSQTHHNEVAGLCGSVVCTFRRLQVQPRPGQQHSFMEIDHEIFSTVICSLLLIQEEYLSVFGKRM